MEAMQLRHALEMLLTVGEGTQISAVVHMLLQLAQLDGALWRRGLCSPDKSPNLLRTSHRAAADARRASELRRPK